MVRYLSKFIDLLKVEMIRSVLRTSIVTVIKSINSVCWFLNGKYTGPIGYVANIAKSLQIKRVHQLLTVCLEFFYCLRMPTWGLFCYIPVYIKLQRTAHREAVYVISLKQNAFINTLTKTYH